MSARRGLSLFSRSPPLLAPRGKIVIPVVPSSSPASSGSSLGNGSEGSSRDEYHANKHVSSSTSAFLDKEGAESLKRQLQLHAFRDATSAAAESLWRDSKPHLRKQQELVREMGVEGAVREMLAPSKTSFSEELRQRPLDRGILEEIYRGLHGRRIERQLKKGVSWEHWITKGEGTAPVYTTSRKAQQTFAFGGQVRLVRAATHPSQFPVILVPDTATAAAARGRAKHDTSKKDTGEMKAKDRGRGGGGGAVTRVDRSLLIPEVAFVGRTSSGKSSLVNAIVNAMVSPYGHLQGTTNAVRFYSVADKIMFVDCPGYGYYNPIATPAIDADTAVRAMRAYLKTAGTRADAARSSSSNSAKKINEEEVAAVRAPRAHTSGGFGDIEERDMGEDEEGVNIEDTVHPTRAAPNRDDLNSDATRGGTRTQRKQPSISFYPPHGLLQARNVRRVFVCVSARGMQHVDVEYCDFLEQLGIPFSVVLTKTDAAPIRMLARLADHTRCQLVHYKHCKELMLASSLRLAGIDKMQDLIGSMALEKDKMNGATMDFSTIV